jgi:hypothetical protein
MPTSACIKPNLIKVGLRVFIQTGVGCVNIQKSNPFSPLFEVGWKRPKYSEKTCPRLCLSTTNPTWSDPGHHGGNLATNLPSYGTAKSNPLLMGTALQAQVQLSSCHGNYAIWILSITAHKSYTSPRPTVWETVVVLRLSSCYER